MSDETRGEPQKWLSTGRLTALGSVLLFAAVVMVYLLPIYHEHRMILSVNLRCPLDGMAESFVTHGSAGASPSRDAFVVSLCAICG
jgi:hypothetical protein